MLKEYFARREYRKKTAGFFNPDLNIDVSREQFLQILSGDIVNPNVLADPKRGRDYSFMLVGVPLNSPLNSLAGKKWGSSGYENAHLNSEWYAKVSCSQDAYIVFSKQNLVFYFDPRSDYSRGKKFDSVGDLENSLFDGHPTTSPEIYLKVLVSNLWAGEVLKYMRDFKRRFTLE
ncbi:MAG: hypothetical protein WCI72_01550 [archaeon]